MDEILRKISEYEEQLSQFWNELSELKMKIMEAYHMENSSRDMVGNVDMTQVPLAAYEMQLERHLEERKDLLDRQDVEKDKMRKHYRNIILSLSIVLTALIIGIFATVLYIFNDFEFISSKQDGNGLNNFAYETTQGDVIYEPNYPDPELSE